jgi:DNA-binding Lrp family transcriptional regulator
MVMGVTMVQVSPGQERFFYSSLKIRDEILDVYHVFGEYDFIVMMQTESISKLHQFLERIKEMHGVVTARTILINRISGLEEHKPIKALV